VAKGLKDYYRGASSAFTFFCSGDHTVCPYPADLFSQSLQFQLIIPSMMGRKATNSVHESHRPPEPLLSR
jgi:hypothetical protein